jgi:hypothetical protein
MKFRLLLTLNAAFILASVAFGQATPQAVTKATPPVVVSPTPVVLHPVVVAPPAPAVDPMTEVLTKIATMTDRVKVLHAKAAIKNAPVVIPSISPTAKAAFERQFQILETEVTALEAEYSGVTTP